MKKCNYHLNSRQKGLICELLIMATGMGVVSAISYYVGCQQGVNVVHDVLLKYSPELYTQVDALFTNVGVKK